LHETADNRRDRSKLIGRISVALLIALVTTLHYNTAVHIHEAHGIYRRLYYFPIVVAAIIDGWRGGLLASLLVCAAYIPHALGYIGFDPAPMLEKTLEMILYVAIGLLAGVLVGREERALHRWRRTAAGLRSALDEKDAMEEALKRSAALAAVGRLSAGLAHEIRNPLASIKGAAEILSDDFDAQHPKYRFLNVLNTETARLNDVLSRFLDFARPQKTNLQAYDLNAMLQEIIVGMRLRPEMPDFDLRLSDQPRMAIVDNEQMRQLLLNLLLNAAQAAGAYGRVVVRTEAGPIVEIRDNGPGFSDEALANYGTPFFTTRAAGTGLGLAICQRISENHGAVLSVHNSDEGGAIVRLDFAAQE
jgi:two-component system, NtrC family, sensor histidine kinase HydH